MFKIVKDYWFLIAAYFAFCGFLYHIAYWKEFNINGLAYINFTDVLKSSVQPVLDGFKYVFFLSILVFVQIYFGKKAEIKIVNWLFKKNGYLFKPKEFNVEQENEQFTKEFSETGIVPLDYFSILFILNIVYVLFLGGTYNIIIIVCSAAFSYIEKKYNFLYHYENSLVKRQIMIFMFFFIPTSSYYSGIIKADNIKKNKEYQYLISSSAYGKTLNKYGRLKYLGTSDKDHIFTDMNNTAIFMIKTEKIDTLVLYSQIK